MAVACVSALRLLPSAVEEYVGRVTPLRWRRDAARERERVATRVGVSRRATCGKTGKWILRRCLLTDELDFWVSVIPNSRSRNDSGTTCDGHAG
jgi:hypothetical protein